MRLTTLRQLLLTLALTTAPLGAAFAQGSACDNDYNAPGCGGSAVAAGTLSTEREGEGPEAPVVAPEIPETPAPVEDPAPEEA